jgi:small GTP-binding protein
MSDTFSAAFDRLSSIEDRCSSTLRELNDHERPVPVHPSPLDHPLVPLLARGYVKLVLIGDSGVGKTALFNRYRNPCISKNVHVSEISRSVGGTQVRMRLWDTPGNETFRERFPVYLKNASAVCLVYDVCRGNTFKSLPGWLSLIRQFCLNNPVVVLIANKSRDSAREVSESEGAKFAHVNALPIFENGFWTGDGLENALLAVLAEIDARDPEAFPLLAAVDRRSFSTRDEQNECNTEIRARFPPSGLPQAISPRPKKVVLLGDSFSGKSSLYDRWCGSAFDSCRQSTVGAEWATVARDIDGDSVALSLWDTPGQGRFRSMCGFWLRGAVGAFIVFDVTDRLSFDGVSGWLSQATGTSGKGILLMVIGCKIDCGSRCVSVSEAADFALANRCRYFEASASTGEGVEEPLIAMMREAPWY